MANRTAARACLALAGALWPAGGALADAGPAGLRAMVERDWAAQEKRFGRSAASPEAIRDALRRAEQLGAGEALRPLRSKAAALDALDEAARLALYRQLRWLARERILRDPLLAGRPVAFMKRRRFICQMLHEVAGRLPKGNHTTLAVSFDARTGSPSTPRRGRTASRRSRP